jgi:aldehyde:ferredoxin oxidoreductase
MIVNREGFGDLLAEGWLGLYKKLGLDPQEYWYAGICKGVDFIYDARPSRFHPLMMTFFTRPRPHHGGSHTLTNKPGLNIEEIRSQVEEWGIPEETVERIFTHTPYSGKFNVGLYTKYMEDQMRVKNSLGICSMYTFFNLIPGYVMADLYSTATGIKLTAEELMECGERISNIAKLLNVREGFSRVEDSPPEIWFKPLVSPEGRIEMTDYFETKILTRDDINQILDDYYRERGWDLKTGVPKKEKIMHLGLQDFVSRSFMDSSGGDTLIV